MAKEPVTEASFDGWLTPMGALDILPKDWGQKTSARWIADRLSKALIYSAARVYVHGHNRKEFSEVPTYVWENWAGLGDHHFWATGDLAIYSTAGSKVAHAFDVRFDPTDFPIAAPQIPLETLVPSKIENPTEPISEAEMRRFAELYLGLWGSNAIEAQALAAIRCSYPSKKIGRDPFYMIFRELRGTGRRGRPPVSGN